MYVLLYTCTGTGMSNQKLLEYGFLVTVAIGATDARKMTVEYRREAQRVLLVATESKTQNKKKQNARPNSFIECLSSVDFESETQKGAEQTKSTGTTLKDPINSAPRSPTQGHYNFEYVLHVGRCGGCICCRRDWLHIVCVEFFVFLLLNFGQLSRSPCQCPCQTQFLCR